MPNEKVEMIASTYDDNCCVISICIEMSQYQLNTGLCFMKALHLRFDPHIDLKEALVGGDPFWTETEIAAYQEIT